MMMTMMLLPCRIPSFLAFSVASDRTRRQRENIRFCFFCFLSLVFCRFLFHRIFWLSHWANISRVRALLRSARAVFLLSHMALAMASTESRERKGRGSFDSWRGREEDSVICGREHIVFESLSMLLSIGLLAWYGREGRQRHGRPGQLPTQYAGESYARKSTMPTLVMIGRNSAFQALLQLPLHVAVDSGLPVEVRVVKANAAIVSEESPLLTIYCVHCRGDCGASLLAGHGLAYPPYRRVDRWIGDMYELRLSDSSKAERRTRPMLFSRTADFVSATIHLYKSDCAYFVCARYVSFQLYRACNGRQYG